MNDEILIFTETIGIFMPRFYNFSFFMNSYHFHRNFRRIRNDFKELI